MTGRFPETLRNQAENLSQDVRQGQSRQRPDDSMGNTADDTFMRRGDDQQDMTSSVPRRQQQQPQQGFRGSDEYGTGGMATGGDGEYTTARPYEDVTTSPDDGTYGGRHDTAAGAGTTGGDRFGTIDPNNSYNPAQTGTYDSERRRQPGVGGEARDEYGSGTSRGSSNINPNPPAGGSVGGTGGGLGAVSGMDSTRRDDDAYGTSPGAGGQQQQQRQPHKRKDSTFGKLMEKAGGVLGNKNLEEKGHQRRESAAGREKNI